MQTKISCPHCHFEFDVDEILAKNAADKLEQKIRKELETQLAAQMQAKQEALDQKLKQQSDTLRVQMQEKFQADHENLIQKLQANDEMLKNRERMLEKMRAQNLEFLKQKDAWEQEKQNLALESQKKMLEQREKIQAELSSKLNEQTQLRLAEKDKKIADYEKQVAQMQRKLNQNSQQLQGEVLELQLEETLRHAFADDLIEPIPKGVNGADIRQRVFNTKGSECGKIIWESKRTKNWTEGWIPKLKADQRAEKADLAVLVTTVMPKSSGTKKYDYYQGIWICQPELATFISQLLRFHLIRISHVVESQASKDEKVESLYRYLTGPEFSQKIESQYETIASMRQQLEKEKTFWAKHFATREKEIDALQESVVTMYGGLQGVTNNALPTVKLLEGE